MAAATSRWRVRRARRAAVAVGFLWIAVFALAAAPVQAGDGGRRAETVSVFAAASLTDSFRAIAREFEKLNGGTAVELNLAGSPTLVRQIVEGAPADVFASADEASMESLRMSKHVVGEPVVFARNSLAIAVDKGNPHRIAGLADLVRPKLIIALCAPTVPAGRYAREAFRRAGVPVPAASEELDVRAALTKVELGEADAAVVYVTDVRARAERIERVAIPDAHNVVARYPIARLVNALHTDAARRFVDYVLSPAGQRILADHGFRSP